MKFIRNRGHLNRNRVHFNRSRWNLFGTEDTLTGAEGNLTGTEGTLTRAESGTLFGTERALTGKITFHFEENFMIKKILAFLLGHSFQLEKKTFFSGRKYIKYRMTV